MFLKVQYNKLNVHSPISRGPVVGKIACLRHSCARKEQVKTVLFKSTGVSIENVKCIEPLFEHWGLGPKLLQVPILENLKCLHSYLASFVPGETSRHCWVSTRTCFPVIAWVPGSLQCNMFPWKVEQTHGKGTMGCIPCAFVAGKVDRDYTGSRSELKARCCFEKALQK